MTSKKLPLLIILALLLSLGSACTTHRGDRTHTNFLGIYERQTYAYTEVSHATIPLRRANVDPGAELSGHKTSILWGLFTYYDY